VTHVRSAPFQRDVLALRSAAGYGLGGEATDVGCGMWASSLSIRFGRKHRSGTGDMGTHWNVGPARAFFNPFETTGFFEICRFGSSGRRRRSLTMTKNRTSAPSISDRDLMNGKIKRCFFFAQESRGREEIARSQPPISGVKRVCKFGVDRHLRFRLRRNQISH
jgi:hypothetical protein